jgi:hypothetical protein
VRKIEIVKAEGLYSLDPPDRSIERPVLSEEDTCMSYEEEDTFMSGASRSPQLTFGSISSMYGAPPFGKVVV